MDQIHAYKLNRHIKYVISWPTLILMAQTCLKKKLKGAAALEQQHSNLTSGHISGLKKSHLVGRGLLH